MSRAPLRLGMTILGDGRWRGGVNYQRTLLGTIEARLSGRIDSVLLAAPSEADLVTENFADLLPQGAVIDARMEGAGKGRRALAAIVRGRDAQLAELVEEHRIDVMLEHIRYFGPRFPCPLLCWMPDFQHRHLPRIFTRKAWWRRELGFRAQSIGPRVALVSSESARRDCERAYSSLRGRTEVARFAPTVDVRAVHANALNVRERYGLPQHFVYAPNQYWLHKNHRVVLDALVLLKQAGALAGAPAIVMTGDTKDERAPGLFERDMTLARETGVASHFLHFGLVPFADVLALNATADAVLNPSLFEGWASSVEEAKALGSPLILSDIPVHREQAEGAVFFQPADGAALAQILRSLGPRRPTSMAALDATNEARQVGFAESIALAVERTSARFGAIRRAA
ncbi:MAG: glycosyltransferase [Croceibacterium sp.]